MTVGLTALEATLDGDPASRLLQGRWLIGQDGGVVKSGIDRLPFLVLVLVLVLEEQHTGWVWDHTFQ